MNEQIPEDLIRAAFFFVDIVGLSNPILSTETQRTKIKILNEITHDCHTFRSTPKEDLIVLPTGDGMLIGFKGGLEQPINLAIELHDKLRNYNLNVPNTEKIAVRIGCNVGNIFVVKDVMGNNTVWGPGAILAKRIMDLGDENHILLTASMADDLIELSKDYDRILHPMYDYKIKHDEEILVYNAYDQDFGNLNHPKRKLEKIKTPSDIFGIKKDANCEKTVFNLLIKDLKSNLIKHERTYYFVNNSIEPIYEISINIMTNTEKEVQDLNINLFDENDEELRISKVFLPSPFSKEIIVKLKRPVFNGDIGKMIKVHYEVEESRKYFENLFLENIKNFELNFILPYNSPITPKLYHIDFENKSKIIIDESKKNSKELIGLIQWKKSDGINSRDMIRLEW